MPSLTIIAGPNGSGKSTLTRSADFDGSGRLLYPDAIARRLNPSHPSAAAIPAGREVLKRTAEYLTQGVSFAIETTLSGHGILDQVPRRRRFAGRVVVGQRRTAELGASRQRVARLRRHGADARAGVAPPRRATSDDGVAPPVSRPWVAARFCNRGLRFAWQSAGRTLAGPGIGRGPRGANGTITAPPYMK